MISQIKNRSFHIIKLPAISGNDIEILYKINIHFTIKLKYYYLSLTQKSFIKLFLHGQLYMPIHTEADINYAKEL